MGYLERTHVPTEPCWSGFLAGKRSQGSFETSFECAISPVVLRLCEAGHLHLPGPNFSLVKQDAGSAPEVLVAINGLVAAPAEVRPAAAADHVAAACCLLDCHLAGGALLCAFLQITTRSQDHQS